MPREFPAIGNFGSAFRFALTVEQACADLAAAADVLSPDAAWHARLEALVCTHDDRVQKLTMIRQEVNEMTLEPLQGFDGSQFTAVLASDPASTWPACVEQLIAAEEDAARFHDAFVAHADDVLAASGRAFTKAAKQERAAAAELRAAL
jgi:hypothetical protein